MGQLNPTAHQVSLFSAGPARLAHLAGQHIARGVCGVGVVKHLERVRMAAFCANEYLDFHIKDRIVWLNPFEP